MPHSNRQFESRRGGSRRSGIRAKRLRHLIPLVGSVGICTLLLAGCATMNPAKLPSLQSAPTHAVDPRALSATHLIQEFDTCMKAHGVLVPPDLNPLDKAQTSKYPSSALAACAAIQVRLLQAEHPVNVQQELANSLKFAECMRKEGIPTDDPKLGPRGQVDIGYGAGVTVTSPKFQHALLTCSAG